MAAEQRKLLEQKMDLGPCPKIHSEKLKADYERAKTTKEYGFEFDYYRDLQKYVDECNRRVDAAQRRLEKTPEEIAKSNQLIKDIAALEELIAASLDEVEILGEAGEVARAVDEFHTIENLKVDKERKEKELLGIDSEVEGTSSHQKLQVCDVCGAYLSRLDNDRRLADHFGGKMHLGYARMREAADAIKKVVEKKRAEGFTESMVDRGNDRYGDRGDRGFDRDRGDRGYSDRRNHRGDRGGYRGRGGDRRGGGGGFRNY